MTSDGIAHTDRSNLEYQLFSFIMTVYIQNRESDTFSISFTPSATSFLLINTNNYYNHER